MKTYFVYIVASQENGTIYIGVTNNLSKRVWEHKNKIIQGFTSKYNVNKLVYYESYTEIESAITREKVLKKWNRQWKINLIKKDNPNWLDLSVNGHF
jgi:putative endonuclease